MRTSASAPHYSVFATVMVLLCAAAVVSASPYLSPQAIVVSKSGEVIYVALGGSQQIALFDAIRGSVAKRIDLDAEPTGMTLSADESRLFVTSTDHGSDFLQVVRLPANEVIRRPIGTHGMRSPVLSPDGKKLYMCSRFDNSVAVLDAASLR